MSYMICHGRCIGCGLLFGFNPDLVPSVRVKGVKEPICQACVNAANPIRKEKGLEEIQVRDGAYEPQEVPI